MTLSLAQMVRHPYVAGTIAHGEALDALVGDERGRREKALRDAHVFVDLTPTSPPDPPPSNAYTASASAASCGP